MADRKIFNKSMHSASCVNVCLLCRTFALQATTHGLRRIADSEQSLRKLVWSVIFLIALAGCSYHCSFIINRYLKFPKVTTTEEIHARELDFPALTVCNLNILKKSFLDDQFLRNRNIPKTRGFCEKSIKDFLDKSQTKDLSDIWMNLGITADMLEEYGHKVYDLIVQCSYNTKDCFNRSITKDLPMVSESISITNYISTRLGYCHTILLNQTTLGKVRRTGQTLGLTLTLNIEREHYLDLLSPEYGVRIMVHPRRSHPTPERGGIVLHPGTKTYVSIKIRQIERLPAPYGDCTRTFRDSPLSERLQDLDNEFLLKHDYYTYEFCQSLCREVDLWKKCDCVEEKVNLNHSFCNPCNESQERCRVEFNSNFTGEEEDNVCTQLCKPACEDIRYDVTLSRSEWPNLEFQEYVLQRWPELISDFVESNKTKPGADGFMHLNKTYLKRWRSNVRPYRGKRSICTPLEVDLSVLQSQNFLRVHVYIQEMNYLYFKDTEAYKLPEMFADLGGCLGLYIGVSVISIIEVMELFTSILALGYNRISDPSLPMKSANSSLRSVKKRRKAKVSTSSSTEKFRLSNHFYQDTVRPRKPAPPVYKIQGTKRILKGDMDYDRLNASVQHF